MSFYRMYGSRTGNHSAPERVTDESIGPRLTALLENKDVPGNTTSFLQSLLDANKKYSGLTSRQYEAMQKVEQRFSAENVAQAKAWSGEYDEEKRQVAQICAQYYIANPPYYADLAQRILNEPEFVPTERQWHALCENKYAKKVIAATNDKPKYAAGSLVCGRATAGWNIQNQLMVVIEVNAEPVTKAARGSKVYRVLPIGSPTTKLVLERDIKKSKKTV